LRTVDAADLGTDRRTQRPYVEHGSMLPEPSARLHLVQLVDGHEHRPGLGTL
jgi:hypothetical protein